MHEYTTIQNLNPAAITMGVLQCLAVLGVVGALVVKAFRSF